MDEESDTGTACNCKFIFDSWH